MNYNNRTGRKPLAKARVIRAMRALQGQGIPATLNTILKREPALAKSSALQALAQLPGEANMQVRLLPGSNRTRQYILCTAAQHYAIQLDPDTLRFGARAENTLLLILREAELGSA